MDKIFHLPSPFSFVPGLSRSWPELSKKRWQGVGGPFSMYRWSFLSLQSREGGTSEGMVGAQMKILMSSLYTTQSIEKKAASPQGKYLVIAQQPRQQETLTLPASSLHPIFSLHFHWSPKLLLGCLGKVKGMVTTPPWHCSGYCRSHDQMHAWRCACGPRTHLIQLGMVAHTYIPRMGVVVDISGSQGLTCQTVQLNQWTLG